MSLGSHVDKSAVRSLLSICGPHLRSAVLFSVVINLLYLTPSIFMLQVYERVVPTAGVMTLTLLIIVMTISLGALALLEWLRGRVMVKAAATLEAQCLPAVLRRSFARQEIGRARKSEILREFDTVRSTAGGPLFVALLDLPWIPIYVLAACALSPFLSLYIIGCAALIMGLGWLAAKAGSAAGQEAARQGGRVGAQFAHLFAYAGEARGLGMAQSLIRRLIISRDQATREADGAAFNAQRWSAWLKFVRLVVQSLVLALAALLVINHQMSAGAIFASSLLLGRALSPIDILSSNWKGLKLAQASWTNIHSMALYEQVPEMLLPAPAGAVTLEAVTARSHNGERIALHDISCAIAPGEIIGIAGPSGAGKSALLRTIAGLITPVHGTIRFDGTAIEHWADSQLGSAIGYLPQELVLHPGTIRENISRFADTTLPYAQIDQAVIDAARRAGVHSMIQRLPDGYGTVVGPGDTTLSPGQAQRVSLARALFGSPSILVLDDPSTRCDAEGKMVLARLIAEARQQGTTVLLSSHDTDLLAATDKIMIFAEGRLVKFGPFKVHNGPAKAAA
ncbi:type I secretion system permease/ATPase [Sphingomonas crocodyli]|uniref:ATP-binding cassette domain-containing protein n=1 Tax=Sphingomonas crocodyli TaxID=1979270 RepID=A0A437LXN8_9SPHN|nr:ATP-binding cassette domain-containing protein [Sphingomonas crocodyli]RVT90170.1 ATP-binding cassette domain-containing protein [Sphingomonas crocodyli]